MPNLLLALRLITLFGWLYWLIFYWSGGVRLVKEMRDSLSSGQSRLDTLLMLLIALLSLVLLLSSVSITFGWLSANHNILLTLCGSLLALSGMAGTFYCRSYLGHYWKAQVALLDDHRVIDKGPYGVVRHPIYTSAIVLYIGTALAFYTSSNLQTVILVVLAYAIKAELEDRYLAQRLMAYRSYQMRVPYRLIPFIW